MKTAKDGKFPLTVSEGRVTAKIHKVVKIKNDKTYVSYVADYILLGQRKQVVRANLDEAKQIALDACRLIAGGQQMALILVNGERLAYVRATEALSPLAVALDVAATEYAAALQILGGKATIAEACRDWVRRNATECPRILIPDAVELFKKQAEQDRKSDERRKQFRIVLDRFALAFNVEAHTMTPGLVSTHLSSLPLSDRSKRNHRDVIGCFNRWLILKGYLPKGTDWLENVQNYSARKTSEIEIYAADEVVKLLQVAGDLTPFIAIGAFAGLRSAEISRLDWNEIDLDGGFIEVKATKSKTGERRPVPIHDNLRKWLLPYRKDSGKVVPYKNVNKQLSKVARRAGIRWKHNGLRHSYISYRVAECADIPRVADESGNSPTIIRQHYLHRVRPHLAAIWFGIVPEKPMNVISIPVPREVAA